jgi:hypothetical protein
MIILRVQINETVTRLKGLRPLCISAEQNVIVGTFDKDRIVPGAPDRK